ncbi:MAG TPA: tetratricopeptide repeat protein, partial [Ardenticatenaceae bacterium]|nr:tetratricopeptide repeat protein [Ardenticatenaceae bacterium]
VARQGPILLTLDTYEIVDHVDLWVRLVIRRAGPRVVWVLAGRNNLADSRKYGAGYFTGYRAEFPGERLRVFPLSEFSVADIAEYFQHRVPGRPLAESEAEAIHEATLGIPLAVKEAAAIWARPETVLRDITGDESPSRDRRKVVEQVTARFLLHCFDDPGERSRLYALALAYRADADLVAAMLETEELERDLSELERRHSFVFVRDMTLHDAVKSFIREYLLADVRRTSREVRTAHERAVAHLRARLQDREARLLTLEARVADEHWTADTTALVHHAFWLSEEQGLAILLPAQVAGLAYDDSFSRALLDAAEPLRPTLSNAGRRRLEVLRTRRPWSPNLEHEAAFLAELKTSQRDWPKDGCEEERQVILALKRGQLLFRQERKSEALRQYERAKQIVPSEAVELRRQLGEALDELASALMWPESSQSALFSVEAERALEHAVELLRENLAVWYRSGAIHYLAGRYDQALVAYKRALELDPKYAHPHHGLGNVYDNLGQYEQAIAAYRRAIELDP